MSTLLSGWEVSVQGIDKCLGICVCSRNKSPVADLFPIASVIRRFQLTFLSSISHSLVLKMMKLMNRMKMMDIQVMLVLMMTKMMMMMLMKMMTMMMNTILMNKMILDGGT
jgi:hypothetical protein